MWVVIHHNAYGMKAYGPMTRDKAEALAVEIATKEIRAGMVEVYIVPLQEVNSGK